MTLSVKPFENIEEKGEMPVTSIFSYSCSGLLSLTKHRSRYFFFPTFILSSANVLDLKALWGKKKNAGNQYFFLFSHCFLAIRNRNDYFAYTFTCIYKDICIIMFLIWSHNQYHFVKRRLLTLSQTTNFRLFQTERICRIQFLI